jgi:hypothetical protein
MTSLLYDSLPTTIDASNNSYVEMDLLTQVFSDGFGRKRRSLAAKNTGRFRSSVPLFRGPDYLPRVMKDRGDG